MTQPEPSTQVLDPWVAPPTQPPVAPPPQSGPPTPPSGDPKRGGGRRVAEISLVALLAAGLASGGTYAVTRANAPGTAQGVSSVSAPVVQANGSTPDWAATAKAVSPSVVAIRMTTQQGEGEGSGVIIDKAGHVLTNNHVATGAGANAKITVTLDDGRTYNATIAGTDAATDLAVLTLQNPPDDLTPDQHRRLRRPRRRAAGHGRR